MAVVRCERCDSYIDLDWNVEEIIYINNNAVCVECATEEEVDTFEAECEEEHKRKSAIWKKQAEAKEMRIDNVQMAMEPGAGEDSMASQLHAM